MEGRRKEGKEEGKVDDNVMDDSDEVGVTCTPIQAFPAMKLFQLGVPPVYWLPEAILNSSSALLVLGFSELRQGQDYLTVFFDKGVRTAALWNHQPRVQEDSSNHKLPYQHCSSLFGTRQSDDERTSTLLIVSKCIQAVRQSYGAQPDNNSDPQRRCLCNKLSQARITQV